MVGNGKTGKNDCHPISAKTSAPQSQPMKKKAEKGKTVENE